MAVSNTTSTISYSGTNTGNQTCPIPFLFLDNSDIVVTLLPATGVSIVLVLGTQFELAGAGNDAGGTAIIFEPVPTTTTINISRNVPATQLTSFVTADRFPAKTIERAFDKATMLVQQFLRASNRTLRFGAASPEQPELAPVPTSGQFVLGTSGGVLGWQTPPQVVLADGAVTNAKIADGAITSSKIAAGVSLVPDGSITNSKLAPNSVTSANIAPGTIVDTDVADNSVTDSKLTSTGVSPNTYPASSAINRIPRFTITSKGRITSATTIPLSPYVQSLKFAEATTGEVGYQPFLNGSIFLDSKGSLRAAGVNTNGRMGIGVDKLATNAPTFVTIPFIQNDAGETISKFWVTENNLFVLSSTGKLYGCGANGYGQLGQGGTDTTERNVLVRIGTLTNVVDFAVSNSSSGDVVHCLAVTSSGELFAWGWGGEGQLGFGNALTIYTPTRVTNTLINGVNTPIGLVSKCYAWGGNGGFSYIIYTNGDVYSTGNNEFGQLGLGDNTANNLFERIPTLKADAIFGCGGVNSAAGAYRRGSVWIVRNGEVWATGSNVGGTLGYGDVIDKNAFVKLGLTNVVGISCANNYAGTATGVCAMLLDGTIRLWGDNAQGQLGIGSATTTFSTPQPHPSALAGRSIVKTQFIGSNNSGANLVVLDSVGDIWVAGYQGRIFGRGIAINANQSSFLKVISPVSFSDFRVYGIGGAAGPTILAQTQLGELWAWGNNNNFQCGVGAGTNISTPQRSII